MSVLAYGLKNPEKYPFIENNQKKPIYIFWQSTGSDSTNFQEGQFL